MWFRRFSQQGIVGINGRNRDYVMPENKRRNYRFADSKLATKELALQAGIPVPELYGVISFQHEVKTIKTLVDGLQGFVIKPDQGSGGGGIMVIREVMEMGYRKSSGVLVRASDIRYHLQNTLSGMFSLGSRPDRAVIEYPVAFDPVFDEIAYQGIPDIRVLVHKGEPAMAMLRLPTRASDGRANLHTGGVGVGIEMDSGKTIGGVQYNRFIDRHPETGKFLAGRDIPHWPKILEMAAKMYPLTNLGYLGVDIVLDKDKGPMLLEINARPGISIQIANRKGLKGVL